MSLSEESPLRTLVVEDEWPARNYLVELLQASHLAEVVGAVATTEQAREAIQAQTSGVGIECVFVDIQLLGQGGNSETGLDLVRSLVGGARAPMFVLATAFPPATTASRTTRRAVKGASRMGGTPRPRRTPRAAPTRSSTRAPRASSFPAAPASDYGDAPAWRIASGPR